MHVNTIEFTIKGDNRGSLVALEANKNIPFNIKRVYYIFGTKPNIVRGKHAHKKLQQVVIVLNGFCKFLLDDGKEKKEVILNKPNHGLVISEMIWREMYDFSSDCVLLVLASEYYDEKDYIRNYDKFLECTNENKHPSDI